MSQVYRTLQVYLKGSKMMLGKQVQDKNLRPFRITANGEHQNQTSGKNILS